MGGPSLVGIGGGGKGGSGASQASGTNTDLANMARELFTETTPLRQEVLGQGLEALKTGGIGAQIPLINRMVEQSKGALSRGLVETEQQMGAAGLAKSPWAQSVLAGQRISGEQNIANIGPNQAMQFVSQIPGFISGQTQISVGGMGQATQAASTRAASENAAYANILSGLFQGAGNAIGGRCWIAERLYGKHSLKTQALRLWLNHHYDQTWFMQLYSRYGQRVARHYVLCFILKPFFEFAAWRIRREYSS